MKTTGGRDTFLLFVVLVLVIGAACYMFVIKKSLNKLNQAKIDLEIVEAEKAEKDKIIEQAEQLDKVREELKTSLKVIEKKLLPDIYTHTIQRKLYKHFEDAGIPYYVEISNDAKKYESVTLPDGTASPDRVAYSSYTIKVSGTDGWLLTHDEGDKIPFEVFYEQSIIDKTIGVGATGTPTTPNKSATEAGITDVKALRSEKYVGYKEFMEAIKKIQADAPDYVKIVDVAFEDQGQGFGYFTATVNVYAFDLINRLSDASEQMGMNYMTWVGADKIATGGLVGLPNYFTLSSPNYNVPEDSPLYNHCVSLVDFKFNVDRPFAAWNMWGYEWTTLKAILDAGADKNPALLELDVQLQLGMITMEEYTRLSATIVGSGVELTQGADAGTTTTTPAT